MPDHPEQVSLYRVYSWDGSHRWACTIEEDEESHKGFRIVDHDPKIADGWFLNQLEQHMRSSVESSYCEERPGGITMCGVETLRPGDPGYFDAAARTAPCAWVGPAPRKG